MSDGNGKIPIVIEVDSTGAKTGANEVNQALDQIGVKTKEAAVGVDMAEKSIKSFGTTAVNSAKDFAELSKSMGSSSGAASLAAKSYAEAAAGLLDLEESSALMVEAQALLNAKLKSGAISTAEYDASVVSLAASLQIAKQETILFGVATAENTVVQKEAHAAVNSFAGGLAALGVAFGAVGVLKSVDEYNQLQAKIEIITKATGDYQQVSEALFETSVKTGTKLSDNVTLFQQISIAAKNIGATNTDIEKFVESFNKVGAVFKLDGSHLSATILDLSHTLESGTVHAQQFNRLMLAFPALIPLVQPLKGEFNTVAEAIKAGVVSSKQLFDVLQDGLAVSAQDFDKLPASIKRATASLNLELTKSFAAIVNNTGAMVGLTDAIKFAGDHSDILAAALSGLAVVAGGAALFALGGLLGIISPLGAALVAAASAMAYLAGKTTETQEAQHEYNVATKAALDIEQKLKTARGDAAEALKNQRQDLIESTLAQIGLNNAKLAELQIQLRQANIFHDTTLASIIKKDLQDINDAMAKGNETLAAQIQIRNTGRIGKPGEAAAHAAEIDKEAEALAAKIQLQKEDLEDQERLLTAKQSGTVAYKEAVEQIKAENLARAAGLEEGDKEYDAFIQRALAIEKDKDAIKALDDTQKAANKTQGEYLTILKQLHLEGNAHAGAIAAQDIEQIKLTESYKNSSPEYKAWLDTFEKGIAGYHDQNEAGKAFIATLELQIKEQEKVVAAQAKPFIQASEDIQRGLETSIENGIRTGFKKGENPVKAFGDLIKDTLIKSLAGAAAAAITGNFVNTFLTSAAGVVGNQNVATSVASQLGVKSAGGNDILSLLSGGKSVYSLASGGGSFASGINSFGSSIGFAQSGAPFSSTVAGASAAGQAGTLTASISSALSAALPIAALAAAGYVIGGAIAPAFGGKKQGGEIGGALGGLPGAIIGSYFGPSQPKVVASEFQAVAANGGLTGITLGSKGTDTKGGDALSTSLNTFLVSLQSVGVSIANSAVRGSINSNVGNKFDLLGASGLSTDVTKSISFNPSDEKSVSAAIAAVGVELAKGANVANASLNIALQNIKTTGRTVDEVISDLGFSAGFDKLGQAPKVIGAFETAAKALLATFTDGEEKTNRLGLDISKYKEYETTQTKAFFDSVISPAAALSPLRTQLESLHKNFDDLRAAATVLGYSLGTVTAGETKAVAAMTVSFNQGIADQIQQIVDPTAYAIAQLDAQFAVLRDDAAAVGGDTVAITKLYNLQLANITAQAQNTALSAQKTFLSNYVNNQITAQNSIVTALQNTQNTFTGFAASLTAARNGLLINPALTNLSPQQQLATAKSQYELILQAAKGGDQTALGGLDQAGQNFLTASKAYNASSVAYFADFTEVLNGLQDTAAYAKNQASIASQQLSVEQAQLTALNNIATHLNGAGAVATAASGLLPANPNQNFGKNSALNQALATVTNYRGDFGSGGFQAYIPQAADDEKTRARAVIYSYGGVPGFAGGGDFNGGLRIVGEHGAELEATGASRIFNAGQTKSILAAATGSDNRTAEGVDNLVRLTQNRINQSIAETNALRADLANIKKTNDALNSKLDRMLSKAR